MSLTLAATDTITGVASAATSITYTITGDEIAAGVDAFKVLGQGQLPATVGTLYPVPASTEAIVKTIHLVNGTGGAVTAALYVKGTAAANAILPPISILAGGFATYGDDGWQVYDSQGRLLSVGATGATGEGVPVGGATDEALIKASASDYDTAWAARLADTGVITYLDGTVAAAPGTPASGKLRIYAKTGKVLAVKDDAGAETELGAGGAPTEILDIPTAEDDDSLVLAPDGMGGVEFRAETGGGGGGTPAESAAALVTAYGLFR